ncbi:MAG: hypothetical protein FWF03_02045, partial [Defluviitaleaceae bacterium]|nr:hypothetical protein [Defluviitaleaceae bacterium]
MEILLASSLDKIFYDAKPNLLDAPELNVIAKNGMFSFQAALRPGGENFPPFGDYAAEVRTELNAKIRVRQVLNVPSRLPVYGWADDFCLRNEIGFYPDALEDKDVFRLVGGRWNSLWIDVTPANKVFEAGEYKIEIVIKDADGSEAARAETKLAVVDAAVPRAPFKHTEWFHTDCLANYYGVSVFSKRYWEITGNFMKSAAGLGVNMILTPVVTPPLDTIQGGERTTVQLADIFFENGKYRFGFDMLSRWIDIAKDAGIEYFEICHLFTQWGALHAPKILVSTDGGAPEQKFGWETAADGDEYVGFLRQFIPALRDFLDKKGVLKNSYFHISDEPGPEQFGQYKKLHSIMKPLLAGCKIFDALSDPAFYSEGLVEIPVVATDHYEGFEALGVKEKWVYYCCGQSNLVSNRFIALPSARSRILGVQ